MNQTPFLSKFKISPNFHNYFTTTTTFITKSPIGIIIIPIHQQHVFKHHQPQLVMNSFQVQQNTISSFITFSQKHNIFTYMIFDI